MNEWIVFLHSGLAAPGMSKNSDRSIGRGQLHQLLLICSVYNWPFVCVCWETTTHQRPSNPIRGQILVGVYQEAWTQTRYITNPSPLCLPHAYLYIPWKLTRVASVTIQNEFHPRGPSLLNLFMACCVSGSHPQAAGSLLLCCRSEAETIKQSQKMHRWRRIWRCITSCPLLTRPFEDAPGLKGQKEELNTCFLHLQHICFAKEAFCSADFDKPTSHLTTNDKRGKIFVNWAWQQRHTIDL